MNEAFENLEWTTFWRCAHINKKNPFVLTSQFIETLILGADGSQRMRSSCAVDTLSFQVPAESLRSTGTGLDLIRRCHQGATLTRCCLEVGSPDMLGNTWAFSFLVLPHTTETEHKIVQRLRVTSRSVVAQNVSFETLHTVDRNAVTKDN